MAVQEGAKSLERPGNGRGVFLGGVPGVPPGRVLVLGAGVAGNQAAKMAAGLGAHVSIMEDTLNNQIFQLEQPMLPLVFRYRSNRILALKIYVLFSAPLFFLSTQRETYHASRMDFSIQQR